MENLHIFNIMKTSICIVILCYALHITKSKECNSVFFPFILVEWHSTYAHSFFLNTSAHLHPHWLYTKTIGAKVELTCATRTINQYEINTLWSYQGKVGCNVFVYHGCVEMTFNVTVKDVSISQDASHIRCLYSPLYYAYSAGLLSLNLTHIKIWFISPYADKVIYSVNKTWVAEQTTIGSTSVRFNMSVAIVSIETSASEKATISYALIANNTGGNVTNYLTFVSKPSRPIGVWIAYVSNNSLAIHWRMSPQNQTINIYSFQIGCVGRNVSVDTNTHCNVTTFLLKFISPMSTSDDYNCTVRAVTSFAGDRANFTIHPNISMDTQLFRLASQNVAKDSRIVTVTFTAMISPYEYGLVGVILSLRRADKCLQTRLFNCSDCQFTHAMESYEGFLSHVCTNGTESTLPPLQYVRIGNPTNMSISSLKPVTSYDFCAYPIYQGGVGKRQCVSLLTSEALSRAPTFILIESFKPDAISLSWKSPNTTYGELTAYVAIIFKQSSCVDYFVIVSNTSTDQHVDSLIGTKGCADGDHTYNSVGQLNDQYAITFNKLLQNIEYMVEVYPINTAGIGDKANASVRTMVRLPGSPFITLLNRNTPTSFLLVWREPSSSNISEQIVSYEISVNGSMSKKMVENIEILSFVIEGLGPCTHYTVKIRANTSEGFGPYSNAVENSTQSVIPGLCTELAMNVTSATKMTVSWIPPKSDSCPLMYFVQLANIKSTKLHLEKYFEQPIAIITGLTPYTEYAFRVRAMDSKNSKFGSNVGEYSAYSNSARTFEDLSNQVTGAHISAVAFDQLRASWASPNVSHGKIVAYVALLKHHTGCSYFLALTLNNSENTFVHQLNNETTCLKKTIQRQPQLISPFQHTFAGLRQNELYSLVVYPINSAGIGSDSSASGKTEVKMPGPPIITKLYRHSPTVLLLSWLPPIDSNISERINSYEITISHENQYNVRHAKSNTNFRNFPLSALWPCTMYTVKVRSKTNEGHGTSSNEHRNTTQSNQPGVCLHQRLKVHNSTALLASWSPPENTTCPLEYDVSLTVYETKKQLPPIRTAKTILLFSDLTPFTEYSFQVRASVQDIRYGINIGNHGDISRPSRTAEAHPGAPQSLSCYECTTCNTSIKYNSISCSWNLPLHSNGVITKYTVRVDSETNNMSISDDTRTLKSTIISREIIHPDTNIMVRVSAWNGAGNGPVAQTNISIGSGPPKMVATREEVEAEMRRVNMVYNLTTQVPIRLPVNAFSATQGKIIGFDVVIVEKRLIDLISLNGSATGREKTWLSSDRGHVAPYQLYATPRHPNHRRRRDTSDPDVVLVGERHDCESPSNINTYCNGPLRSGVEYAVAVRAFTANNFVTAGIITVTTSIIPSAPTFVKCAQCDKCEDTEKDNSIFCKWKEPLSPHGNITGYKIIVRPRDINIPPEKIITHVLNNSTHNITISNNRTILPDLTYTVTLIASNEAGFGNPNVVDVPMKSSLLDHLKYDPEVQEEIIRNVPTPPDTSSQIAVRLPQMTNTELLGEVVEGFNLVVVEKQLQARVNQYGLVIEDIKTWASSDIGRIAPYRVLDTIHRIPARSRRETSSNNDASIVYVGVDSTCVKADVTAYCNGRLRSDVEYVIYVRAYTKTTYQTMGVVLAITTESPASQQVPVHVIAIVTVGAALFLAISIMVAYMCRKHLHMSQKWPHVAGDSSKWLLEQAVSATDFAQYYRDITAESVLYKQFIKLYEVAHADTARHTFSFAKHEMNSRKNRYTDNLPYDRQRLQLIGNSHGSGSDYINASYVSRDYIAAQSPLTFEETGTSTVNDFWKMIWQQNCAVIVSISNTNDFGGRKCPNFWPKKAAHFGQIFVELEAETYNSFYYKRRFYCQDNLSANERWIDQFHFTAGYSGQTEYVSQMLEFNNVVQTCVNANLHAPMLVHCDDGIDCTGVFIAIDRMTRECRSADATMRIDAWIYEMRMFRSGMVRSFNNYKFLHDCALQHVRRLLGTTGQYVEARSNGDYMSDTAYDHCEHDPTPTTMTNNHGSANYIQPMTRGNDCGRPTNVITRPIVDYDGRTIY